MTPILDGLDGKEWNEWRFVLQAPWGRAGPWVALAVAVVIVVLSVRSTRGERSSGRRVVLGLLRAGSVACALLLLLQPAIQLENVTRLPNRVAVLVDGSASMGLEERPGAGSRAERAAKLVAKARPALAEWRKLHHVELFTFAGAIGAGAS